MPILIEWLEKGQHLRALVKDSSPTKVRVVTFGGRNLTIPVKAFHILHRTGTDPEDYFRDIDSEASTVDLELLHSELAPGGTYELERLAGLWFSRESPDSRELSVVFTACMRGSPWFRVEPSGAVRAASKEDLERRRRERLKEEKSRREKESLEILLDSACAGKISMQAADAGLLSRLRNDLLKLLIEDKPLADWPELSEAVVRTAERRSLSIKSTARRMLDGMGALPDPYDFHMSRFFTSFFPATKAKKMPFTPYLNDYPAVPESEVSAIASDLQARLGAYSRPMNNWIFSIDDEETLEIDDALSAEPVDGERFRVGVHIAAPGLFVAEDSVIHDEAERRGTTVYQPDLKWAMLPAGVIDAFSLKKGRIRPALSLYLMFRRETFELAGFEFRLEAVEVAENLGYETVAASLEGDFVPGLDNARSHPDRVRAWLERDTRQWPWEKAARIPSALASAADFLVPLARRLFAERHSDRPPRGERREFRIKVSPETGIDIRPRRRNCLAEGIVTELMILANSRAADFLTGAGLPAVYRSKRHIPGFQGGARSGPADLTVNPREHADIGAALYCWTTSPLRRFTDLVNQRQLGSQVGAHLPAFRDPSRLLVRAKKVEFQMQTADSHQQRMERYWTLRHMERHPHLCWKVTVRPSDRKPGSAEIVFDDLPLCLPLPREQADWPPGPALFFAETFDLYGLETTGRLESA